MAARSSLVLALAVMSGVAHAQALIPNPGLSTLMQPQRLDRSRPLLPQDQVAGAKRGGSTGATPCRSGAPLPASPSLYGSGSGPGSYGHYIPGAAPATDSGAKSTAATPPQPAAPKTVVADRPLYGGIDRPLWNTGSAAPPSGTAPGKPAVTADAGKDTASAGPAQPNALPAPVRDRPLWADGSLSGSPNPVTTPGTTAGTTPDTDADAAAGLGGIAVSPCAAAPGSLPP